MMVATSKEHDPMRAKGTEKRLPCQVSFMAGDQVSNGTSVHFNDGGMLILCNEPAPLYAKLVLALKFPGSKNPLRINGEVIWTNVHGPADSLSPRGMGVKFVNLNEDAEHVLQEQARLYESFGDMYSCYYT